MYLDAARYAARRTRDGVTESRVLYEVFYAYFLPQFEGSMTVEPASCTRRWPSCSMSPSVVRWLAR